MKSLANTENSSKGVPMNEIMFRAKFRDKNYKLLYDEIRCDVYHFLKLHGNDRFGNLYMWIKIFVLLSAYASSYTLIFIIPNDGGKIITAIIFGIINVLVFFNISHDAIHGTISKNKKINNLFCYSADIIGVSSLIWKIKHNILHHNFTNIFEHINSSAIIRLNSSMPFKKNHRFQMYYCLILYAIYSIYWIIVLDIKLLLVYSKNVQIKTRDYVVFIVGKIVYFSITILIPYLILQFDFIDIVLCFIIAHIVMGFIVSFISVFGHDFSDTQHSHVDYNGIIDSSWFENVINTTADFEANSKIFSMILGGLNLHISHHLFPEISHIHYYDITKIVYKKVTEHGLKANSYTFSEILLMHLRNINTLSKPNNLVHNDI